MPAPVRILGVDTSLRSSGIGCVVSDGVRHRAVSYGVIAAKKAWPLSQCLVHLRASLLHRLAEDKPDVVAIEGIFYCRNVRTAMALGQARGVVIATCAEAGLAIYEYAPRLVKQGMTGSGAAAKHQVGLMMKSLLGLAELPPEDAADALAIACCHANRMRAASVTGGQEAL
jgi:crossover junction endodeoxyribonuclease RuvC